MYSVTLPPPPNGVMPLWPKTGMPALLALLMAPAMAFGSIGMTLIASACFAISACMIFAWPLKSASDDGACVSICQPNLCASDTAPSRTCTWNGLVYAGASTAMCFDALFAPDDGNAIDSTATMLASTPSAAVVLFDILGCPFSCPAGAWYAGRLLLGGPDSGTALRLVEQSQEPDPPRANQPCQGERLERPRFARSRLRRTSTRTARITAPPRTTWFNWGGTWSITSASGTTPTRITAPMSDPQSAPTPPARLVPPMTTAAIELSSAPWPLFWLPPRLCARISAEAIPQQRPLIAYTATL